MQPGRGMPPGGMPYGQQPPGPNGFSWQPAPGNNFAGSNPNGRQQQYQQQPSRGGSDRLPPMPELAQKWNPTGKNEVASTKEPGNKLVIRGQAPEEEAPRRPATTNRGPSAVPPPNRLASNDHAAPRRSEIASQARVQTEASAAKLDFQTVDKYLSQLGATVCRLERAGAEYRFVCALPVPGKEGMERTFESTAASVDEALRSGVEQVQQWRAR